MKERSIIMSGDNPRLILEGRKTQTRRIVKPLNSTCLGYNVSATAPEWIGLNFADAEVRKASIWSEDDLHLSVPWKHASEKDYSEGIRYRVRCRYDVADRLWVRETFTLGKMPKAAEGAPQIKRGPLLDGPSIHMPRWASRITLEILKVRVERLQDISEEDAKAEGMERCKYWPRCDEDCDGSYVQSYRTLWDSLHGKGAWDENPWVWVIEFKKVEANAEHRTSNAERRMEEVVA
jgi:hypothetical protein